MAPEGELLAQWAGRAGAHALALFIALLVAVLSIATSLWWARQRYVALRTRSRLPPLLFIALRLAAGFGVIALGAWVFAEVAEQLGAQRQLGRADQAFTDALAASVPPGAVQVFAAITHLGDTATLTALCVTVAIALVAVRQRGLALGWVAAVAGNGVLNTTLKQVFARVRPVHDGGLVLEHGYSFPSGHSSGSLVAYCMLAYLAWRLLPVRWHLPVALVAVTLAFTVGASRVFLRVHFASDVIAGFASGAAWLTVCIGSVELARWYRGRRG